jgi:hypothetical protein
VANAKPKPADKLLAALQAGQKSRDDATAAAKRLYETGSAAEAPKPAPK